MGRNRATTSTGGEPDVNKAATTEPETPTLPPISESGDQAPPPDPEAEAAANERAARLAEARAAFDDDRDANARATTEIAPGPMPNDLSGILSPAALAGVPPAVAGQLLAEQSRQQRLDRARQVANTILPGTHGRTAGPATDTATFAVPGKNRNGVEVIQCDNCGAQWPYNLNYAGSDIPCSRCGTMVHVPNPGQRWDTPTTPTVEDTDEE